MMQTPEISIVVPAYNESDNILLLNEELERILEKYGNYEIIYVNDGSSDSTLSNIKMICSKNKQVKYISFSKNFGHQAALKAGIDFASGKCVISMDGDMQHPPEVIPEMIEYWKQGYDIVYTQRLENEEISWFKKVTSKFFYKLLRKLSDIPIEEGTADFRLMDRKAADIIKQLHDPYLFIRGLVPWMGFKQKKIIYQARNRHSGQTKYTFRKMLAFAINGITSFSIKPLRLAIFLGLAFSVFSFIYVLYALFIYVFFNKSVVTGWASILMSVLLIGGIQLVVLGIIGEYIGKMYFHIKNRPVYIIEETNIKM